MSRDWTPWPCSAVLFPVFFPARPIVRLMVKENRRCCNLSLKGWHCVVYFIPHIICKIIITIVLICFLSPLIRLIWRSCHARGQRGLRFFQYCSSGAQHCTGEEEMHRPRRKSSALTMCITMQRAKHTSNNGWRQQIAFDVFTGRSCEAENTSGQQTQW